MGRAGLRASEVTYPGDEHLRYSEDGDVWLFEVRGKTRKAGIERSAMHGVSDTVADDIHKFSRERALSPLEPWVDASRFCAPLGDRSRTRAC